MNDDTIQDLKQFIATLVAQEISDVRSDIKHLDNKLSSNIKRLDNKLSAKIDDLSSSIAEALDNTNEANDTQLQDHEQRIIRLERKAA